MSKTLVTGIAVAAAIAVVALFFIFNPFAMSDISGTSSLPTDGFATPSAPGNSGLVIQDEVVGSGTEAKAGDTVTVQYTGKFQNGSVFDSSIGKAPFKFILGSGLVIQGWDQGIQGMKVGGKRVLVIPPNLAYGAEGQGSIPPNSTLQFEVELVKVEAAGTAAPLPEGAGF